MKTSRRTVRCSTYDLDESLSTNMVLSEARIESWNPALALKLAPLVTLEDDQLFAFCQLNRDLRIERDAEGVLVLMAPVGGLSSARNLELCRQLANWAQRDGRGLAFDSSVGFILPNGAMRSPDAAWVRRERWDALSAEQREKFPPLCPDFVVELRSPSDRLSTLQRRVRELIRNGAQLGWLIDPQRRAVHVYRPGEPVQSLLAPLTISADPIMPGFVLDLAAILS
jgi:Uma2 family endonuclease